MIAGFTVYFQRQIPLYLKLFPIYLLVCATVELLAPWMRKNTGSNVPLYNFYMVFNFSFLLFVLREIIVEKLFKKVILFSIIVFVLFSLANIIYVQKPVIWNSMSYALGALLVVAYCIYYFFELFKKPISTKLTREPPFWIVCGLLFFYCCSFPLFGLNNFLADAPLVLLRNLGSILILLNILLYLLFAIAFLCRFNVKNFGKKA
jgi:hypothetical protein